MKVIWLRHAQREMNLSENPRLSDEGLQQARRLVAAAQSGVFPAPAKIHSSPKLRCTQTVAPIAQAYQLSPQVTAALDEQRTEEKLADFRQRIQIFLDSLTAKDDEQCHFLCTHSDWLQEAICLIPSEDRRIDNILSFACAAPLVFEVTDGWWRLDRD